MMTYFCKYTPLEMLFAFSADMTEPNQDAMDFAPAEEIIHSSVCSHAKMLVMESLRQRAEGIKQEMILTNCCDSIRRVYDSLPAGDFSFKAMLDLPHANADYAVKMYTRELTKLMDRLSSYYNKEFDWNIFLEAWKKNAQAFRAFMEDNRPCIAVMGARTSDELFQKIRMTLSGVGAKAGEAAAPTGAASSGAAGEPFDVVNFTCGGLRSLPMPPEGAENLDHDKLLRAYAKALLFQIPCMRMEDVSGRTRLLRKKGLRAVVYHSVRFCDFYSTEYAEIRRMSDLPVLKIESDYTSQSEGQLSTRLEAFAESLRMQAKTKVGEKAGTGGNIGTRMKKNSKADNGKEIMTQTESGKGRDVPGTHRGDVCRGDVYIGIDSGSTTTNVAAIDEEGNLLAWSIVRTGAKAGLSAQRACDEVKKKLGPAAAGIRKIVATGYGRDNISIADDSVTEISCHARGAHFAYPDARCVIDIGGQDSKVICLDQDGNVSNFVMNDKCAAGTGRFLEMMATTLEMDLDTMARAGLTWKRDITITSTCTVFAESEVISLVAENVDTSDIVHALDVSVASKTVSMVRRVQGAGPFMMTGGVAKNEGVAREIERRLGEKLFIMDHPDLIGALGAAIFARG